MGKKSSRDHLAANLKALMDAPGSLYPSAQTVESATDKKGGQKIGRSTVQRIREGQTPVNLDYIESLAKVFELQPWELLQPNLGRGLRAAEPSLEQSLETLCKHLERVPAAMQRPVSALLDTLVTAPRSYPTVLAAMAPLMTPVEEPDPFELESVPSPKAKPQAAHEKRRSGGTTKANIFYGDGNRKQVKLPFPLMSKDELRAAVPKQSERDLYESIGQYPKAKA